MQAMTEHEPHSLLSRTLGDEIVIHQTSNRADDKETTLVSSVGTGLRNNDTNEDLSSYPASADFDTIQCYDSIKSSPTCEQTPGQLYDVDDAGKSIGNETSACSETQCGSQKPHDGFEDSFKTTAPSDSIGSSSARDGSKGRESVREGTKRDNVSNKMSVLSVGEVNDHRFDLSAPWFNSVNDVVRDESLYGCQSAADETGADVAIHDGVSLEARQESEIVTSHRHSPSSCYVVTDAPETVESVEKPLRNCDSVAKSRTYSVGNVAKQEYSSLNGYSTDAIRDTELPAVSRAQVHPSICLMKLHQPSESSLSLSAGFDLSKQDEAGETIVSPSREETANGNVHITRKFVENPRLTELRDMDARIDDNLSCDESVKTSKPTVGAETLTVAGRSRDTDPKPLLSINGQYHGIVTVVATADCLQQHEVQFIANDEDYSVCTEDDEDDFYYTLISSCPTNRSLAAEIAAAESGLRKLAGTGSGRGSRVSSVIDADSRRGSRISAFDDDSRRNSRTWTGDDDFAAGDVIRDGRGDGLLPLDDVIQTAIDVGYNECLAEN